MSALPLLHRTLLSWLESLSWVSTQAGRDHNGLPVRTEITPGQTSDYTSYDLVMAEVAWEI
jgi:hypothetical protein